jgi:regulator of replication initiation timing
MNNEMNKVTSHELLAEIAPSINEILSQHNAITSYGANKLKEMLGITLSDTNLLSRRQEILIEIMEHTAEKQVLIGILGKIKEKEDILEEWFSSEDKANECSFGYNFMNWSSVLTAYNKIKSYYGIFIVIIYILIFLILLQLRASKNVGLGITLKEFLISIYGSYVTFLSSLSTLMTSNSTVIYCAAYASKIIAAMYIIYQSYLLGNVVYGNITHKNKCNKLLTSYHQLIELIKDIEELFDNDIFLKYEKTLLGDHLDDLDDIFIKKVSIGQVITKYKEKDKYKHNFITVIQYVGMIDAFITISGMVGIRSARSVQFNIGGSGYTLPIYVKDAKPYLQIENAYDPTFIKSANSTDKNKINYNVNDCIMDDRQLMIITGPNKAGKTTYMKSILICILLAQTWGISPCTKIVLTPFLHIRSINSHNIQNQAAIIKESLFESEMNKCYELLKLIKETNEFIFVAVDELFTGTNPKEGIAGSYAISDFLAKSNNVISLVSTHFHQICTHNNDNQKQLVLYKKIEAEYNEQQSKYVFPYKLQDGISDQCIALQLLVEKGYSDNIVKNALLKLRVLKL